MPGDSLGDWNKHPNRNQAHMSAWETSESVVLYMCCGADMVVWRRRVRWFQTQVFSLTAKVDVPGSAPGPARDLRCHYQHQNHRLPHAGGGGRPASSSPMPSPGACTVCFGNKSTSSLAADTKAFEQIRTPAPTWPYIVMMYPQTQPKHVVLTCGYCQIMLLDLQHVVFYHFLVS